MTMTMGVTGRINGLKYTPANGNTKARVTFRISARKRFITDQEKQDNKVNTFLPIIARGGTADFINNNFKDGDSICIYNMEYQTYRSPNADPNNNFDDAHIFHASDVGFAGGNTGGNGGQSNNNANYNNNNSQPANNNRQQSNSNNRRQAPAPAPVPAGGVPDIANDDLPF